MLSFLSIPHSPAVDTSMLKLRPLSPSPENFAPFGQVIGPSPDGAHFGPSDAQLNLTAGIPRFYIMTLENRPLRFKHITHHASVTQCLGSVGALPWYIAVAKPSIVKDADDQEQKPVRSSVGHSYIPPSPDEIQVFRVEGPKFLMFNVGTWHSGPYFKHKTMDFYNLELSDTNESDHTTHTFDVLFTIDD